MHTERIVRLLLVFSLSTAACAGGDAPQEETDATEPAATEATEPTDEPEPPAPDEALETLQSHCDEHIGPARVEEVADGLFVAIGFDLANTMLLQTAEGNIVIDVSMSPTRAQAVKAALMEVAPGPTLAVIYSHSHADHLGGASVWVEEGTEVWATEAFFEHLVKQYGAFREVESFRASLQFGAHLDPADLPCSAIGATADVLGALETGVRAPTHTFSGSASLELGGVTIELVEAHGETHDELFVWIPHLEALLPGDNVYAAFPNLYTIRGSSPRPVDAWIESIDAMRRADPAVLVPSHTQPVVGKATIRSRLRDYRDAIQWVRDEVVRAANAGESTDAMAARITLPAHLVDRPGLAELYGQIDWSVRGIYASNLGWFDGRADRLYPAKDIPAREIALMGGADAVLAAAETALTDGDHRWAAHLLGKLRDGQLLASDILNPRLAKAYRAIGKAQANTNGRAYLLEMARGLEQGFEIPPRPKVDDAFLAALPVAMIFDAMPAALKADEALLVESVLRVQLTDTGTQWTVNIRRGVAEIIEGEPLPETPAPDVTLTCTSFVWKGLALDRIDAVVALTTGELEVDDVGKAIELLALFKTGG